METAIQIVLIVSVLSLTVIFVTVGVWVVLILKEVRKTVNKVSKVGEDIEETTHLVKTRVKEGFDMVAILTSVSAAFFEKHNLADFFNKFEEIKKDLKAKKKKNKKRKRPAPIKEKIAQIKKKVSSSTPKRRLFSRAKKA